jgi:uncharacterized protein
MRSLLVLATTLLLPACASGDAPAPSSGAARPHEVVVRTAGGERSLTVRIADAAEERRQGLMGVRELPANDGMAFVYDAPVSESFWMKDTPIPLAIAFVGEDGHILAIREMAPCPAEPCSTYASPEPYIWAVEANSGWFSANGVVVGDEAALLEGG